MPIHSKPDQNATAGARVSLEIKDAQVIFKTVWNALEEKYGEENLCFPKELILLGGAPGSGKGTQTRFILKTRGLTCKPIVVSDLLKTPEAEKIKASGQLVGDTEVVGLVLNELLREDYRDGALLDGFPRTQVQVECLKLLVNRINQLYDQYADSPLATNFRQPTIHAMVLFVSEQTSIARQLHRGVEIAEQNKKAEETGIGDIQVIRDTDVNPASAAKRYRIFKEQTWDALQSLKEIYHYHFIHAEGDINDVEENILKELRYQSSLELDPRTYDRVRSIPVSAEITLHARQELVKRLDNYELNHTALFEAVVNLVNTEIMPVIKRHALSGMARVSSEEELFNDPIALAMLIDVFAERGYSAMIDKQINRVAERVNLETGEIYHCEKVVYRIQVGFKGSSIRRG